jgi:hypothetical protein
MDGTAKIIQALNQVVYMNAATGLERKTIETVYVTNVQTLSPLLLARIGYKVLMLLRVSIVNHPRTGTIRDQKGDNLQ